jgi:hypothetical protein
MPATKEEKEASRPNVIRFEYSNAFLRGLGNSLCLSFEHHAPTFAFRGRNIARITAADAISQDWKLVSSSIASAFGGIHESDERDADK